MASDDRVGKMGLDPVFMWENDSAQCWVITVLLVSQSGVGGRVSKRFLGVIPRVMESWIKRILGDSDLMTRLEVPFQITSTAGVPNLQDLTPDNLSNAWRHY